MTDWNDLTSQALPSLSGAASAVGGLSSTTPNAATAAAAGAWNHRSLADLHVANQTLFHHQQQQQGSGGGGSGATIRPAMRTNLQWNSTTTVPTNTATTNGGATTDGGPGVGGDGNNINNKNESLEEMVARHEQEVLDKILMETETMVRMQTDQMMEQQLQDYWQRDLNVWIRELVGVRTLGGAAGGQHALPLQASTASTALTHGRHQHQQQQQPQYGYSAALGGGSSSASAWQTPLTTAAASNVRLYETDVNRHVDLETLQAHVKIVADWKDDHNPANTAAAVASMIALTDPSNKNKGGSSSRANDPAQAGYATACKWLQTLLLSPTTRAAAGSSLSSFSSPDQATATLVHLCRQFQGRVYHRTRQATSAGQSLDHNTTTTTYHSDLATQCAFYTQLELGSSSTTGPAAADTEQQPPWPVLYYCLRCGDARAALEVWQQAGHSSSSRSDSMMRLPDGLYDTIRRILSTMDGGGGATTNNMTTSRCFWGFGIPPIAAQDRRVVADWLEILLEQQQPDNNHAGDDDDGNMLALYRQGFLTLLSGFDELPSHDKMPGLSSIEDYLLGCLCKAVLQPNPVEEIMNLGSVIMGYGVNYFGCQESGGWAFCLPLLATQRYATALTHLAEAGSHVGLMQAAHLALMLSKSGVPVVDLDRVVPPNDASILSSSDALVASLLVTFVNRLLLTEPKAGSLAALEYLARIPNKNRARKEVASLIANTGDLQSLAGTINADGIRQDGEALDKHFSEQEESLILKEAAELLSRDKSDRQKMGLAAMCYMLAGRYASVLVLLNEMLSPPNQQDENRKYWMEQTESFHTLYLNKKKRTRVMDVLEREGKLGFIQTSRTILEMNGFFEHMRAGRWAEAWAISERLELLPRSQSDVASMENKYRNLDDSVKRVYPSLLLGAMETLYHEYARIKTTDLQGPNASVARERLRELQEKGRAIDTFAGLLGGFEQMGRISTLAAYMV